VSPDWLRFWAWGFPGALFAAPWLIDGAESRVAVFAPWVVAGAVGWSLWRLGHVFPAVLGAAEGAGGVLLMIALVHSGKSGNHPDPTPWLVAGLATMVAGLVAFLVARRL
jgi:hypothetical protein